MRKLTTETRRHGEESGHRTIGSSGHPNVAESVDTKTGHGVLKGIATPVILSGAPREFLPQEPDWRGVEGPRHSLVSPSGIKAFSRELPDASVVVHTSSGSFDSPSSRLAGLGLPQDDSGKGRRLQSILFIVSKQLSGVFRSVLAVLREVFDEAAYDRFLLRTHTARSVSSYREFLREREAALTRKPRCC